MLKDAGKQSIYTRESKKRNGKAKNAREREREREQERTSTDLKQQIYVAFNAQHLIPK